MQHSADPARAAAPADARAELIQIQREIVARLKAEIRDNFGGLPPPVQVYYDEYWREISSFEAIASRAELLAACREADVVYVGDFHTLRASQQAACRLLEELTEGQRPVVLALEMVSAAHQGVLEDYLAQRIDEAEFLDRIDYSRSWDFHWEPYREILELCRSRGLPVYGLNSEPALHRPDRVIERDFQAAAVIERAVQRHPGALVFVFDGDLHVARDHLPLIVASRLRERGLQPRQVVVHQNAEPIYWQLAEAGLERLVDVVRIAPGCYCMFSATPLVALQSYVLWEQNHAELEDHSAPIWRGERWEHVDVAEQVHEIVRTLARFLGIEHPRLDDFEVYTTHDLGFLEALARDRRFSPAMLEEIKRHVRRGESYFVPIANVIYLADFSLYRAAEEAAHFLNTLLGGFDPAPREPRDAFYVRVVREALGFFGSRVLDPRRYCMSVEDYRRFLAEHKGRRLDPEGRGLRELARLVLRHEQALERALAGERRRRPRIDAILRRPQAVQDALAHALGYIVGDKLYAAVLAGAIGRDEVRALFAEPLPPGRAETLYHALRARLAAQPHA